VNDPNLVASIRQRLLNKAKSNGEVFDFVLSRYAIERLLFRLGQSRHADSFVLKGAMLFYIWNQSMHRPTRDVDFLGFGPADCDTLEATFKEIAESPVPEDGLTFETRKIKTDPIREEASYGGVRIKLLAKLGTIRIPLQIDIGFGDAITPSPNISRLPSLISELPAPTIRTYPIYTVVAEKLEAMVLLGEQNSRMKDFFDIHFLVTTEEFSKHPRSKLSTSSPAEAAAGHWQCSTCEESNRRSTQHHYKESRSKLRGIKPKGNKSKVLDFDKWVSCIF
jgi:predicted nucleotidyltransferase component of viral defense system